MLRSGRSLPSAVRCVHRCSITVSARAFIIVTIQSPAFCACAVPGTRGPKATCWRAYESAESPTKSVFAREGSRSHAASAGSAARRNESVRASGILIYEGSSSSAEGGQPMEVVVAPQRTRPLQGDGERRIGVELRAGRSRECGGRPEDAHQSPAGGYVSAAG